MLTPHSIDELSAIIAQHAAAGTPILPVGGGTSLDYGIPARPDAVRISLAALNRVIDYPARDMTITVEAGITMRQLADTLATERQELPVDVPQADRATLGGVIATNWNGPRRYGLGLVRDYVIGITAIDGRGNVFKGGGRVVKNVAGYDFCKLLTGSLGILGVIAQVTLKVRPRPARSLLLAASLPTAEIAERHLAAINVSPATPTSVILAKGNQWQRDESLAALAEDSADAWHLIVGLEGTAAEVDWMRSHLADDWRAMANTEARVVDELGSLRPAGESNSLWQRLVEWPAVDDSPLVVKATVRPSGVTSFMQAAREVDPAAAFLSHAGSGVVLMKFSEFPKEGLSRTLIGKLQPAAAAQGGHLVVVRNASGSENTRQSVWGGGDAALELVRTVKRNFDPHDILNPGRFL
jgi:glycolate oxidase FAD binding subunit